MRIYLDNCVLNRLTDAATHARIVNEANAVIDILRMASLGAFTWIASEIIYLEQNANRNQINRVAVMQLLQHANETWLRSLQANSRAKLLERYGYHAFDALHLATAEEAKCDILITTDDRFLSKIVRKVGTPALQGINPIDWRKVIRP